MRLLLFEYLHAHPKWYRTASSLMKAEGRAMLEAVATDLARAEVSVTMAVCPEAQKDRNVAESVLETTACTVPDFVRQVVDGADFDVVFPIAPELDGALIGLVREFRKHKRTVLVLPTVDVETFSDKWKTFLFLSKHNLPTPTTVLADDFRDLKCDEPKSMVVKRRDGAGCESVEAISTDELSARHFTSATHIVQPRLQGQALSVGLLGSGDGRVSEILPPVAQGIAWKNSSPTFTGGEIPAQLTERTKHLVREMCVQLIGLIEPIVGYVGIDFFLPDGSERPLIMEINPRLCSSYIGYRKATKTNLMRLVFEKAGAISWSSNRITF